MLHRNYKNFWVDMFTDLEDKSISVKIQNVAPVLSIVAVEIVAGVTLVALEILANRWRRACEKRPSVQRRKRR